MIQKIEIQGNHLEVSEKLYKYVMQKIGKLDTFAPRATRPSVHAEVTLKQAKARDKQEFTAVVVLYMPQKTLEASETTINIFAAIDIVEEKLRSQLKKYKETHGSGTKRQLFARARARLAKKESA